MGSLDLFKNPWIAGFSITLISFLLLHFFPDIGKIILIILIAFFLSDIIFKQIVKGKDGAVQIKALGNKIQPKGYVYLAFYLAIVLSAILSGIIADYVLMPLILPYIGDLMIEFLISLSFSVLIYFYMHIHLYW